MSYTPTSWHKGDKVTAEKLNKIEQGIVDAEQSGSSLPDYSQANDGDVLSIENGAPAWKDPSGGGGGDGGVFVVEMDAQTSTLNKTWQEIYDAMASGKAAYIHVAVSGVVAMLSPIILINSQGYVLIGLEANISSIVPFVFVAASADSYPVQQQS